MAIELRDSGPTRRPSAGAPRYRAFFGCPDVDAAYFGSSGRRRNKSRLLSYKSNLLLLRFRSTIPGLGEVGNSGTVRQMEIRHFAESSLPDEPERTWARVSLAVRGSNQPQQVRT